MYIIPSLAVIENTSDLVPGMAFKANYSIVHFLRHYLYNNSFSQHCYNIMLEFKRIPSQAFTAYQVRVMVESEFHKKKCT